jgi:dTDP-4-amino-4,6-dideoxygalactose transaminase
MKWKVSLSDIHLGEEELSVVMEVMRSGWLSMGQKTAQFEREFAEKLKMDLPGVMFNSGTSALHAALHALDLSAGDEVLVPSMTFVADAAVVVLSGAVPVFVDSNSVLDFSMNTRDMECKITDKTKAVIVVHYAGYPADMKSIMAISKKYGIKVIEDVAHGPIIDTPYGMLGTIGDIGCYSFFSSKNITTIEGGMCISSDPGLLEKAKLFRSHYIKYGAYEKHQKVTRSNSYDISGVGLNYRPTDLAAALGIVQLQKYELLQSKRLDFVSAYRELLSSIEGIQIPYNDVELSLSTHHLMPIILKDNRTRNEIFDKLLQAGIQCAVHYPAIHLFDYYTRTFRTRRGDCPVAEQIAERELSLPLHSQLTMEDIQYTCHYLAMAIREV